MCDKKWPALRFEITGLVNNLSDGKLGVKTEAANRINWGEGRTSRINGMVRMHWGCIELMQQIVFRSKGATNWENLRKDASKSPCDRINSCYDPLTDKVMAYWLFFTIDMLSFIHSDSCLSLLYHSVIFPVNPTCINTLSSSLDIYLIFLQFKSCRKVSRVYKEYLFWESIRNK